ncbi:MAG: hypothetical protein KDE28_08015 [Anaerolineales bacterium]|nr:hypothetical protein [Anaerolineales bacterium]
MNMKDVIAKWFAWLKQATSAEDEQLSHVYSDGRQLWATNGYVLHALDVATEKSGRVTLNDEGLFQVEEVDGIPPFAGALPQGEPAASIVISAEALRQAAAGQEGFVRLSLYGENQALELASAGKYALVTPAIKVPGERHWQPR